ncbi:hypothetical protein TNCV_2122911 [Trichonephila clavipes]|nr:hypothetical protein TNCV_2122911 [Trichonephila clavipes]
MPHVGAASGGDDLASTDELKVFKEEGDEEDNRSSENLTELKTSLVTEGEEEKTANVPGSNEYGSPSKNSDCRPDSASHSGKPFELLPPHTAPIGYVVSPYPHPHNGSLGPVSMHWDPQQFPLADSEKDSQSNPNPRGNSVKVPLDLTLRTRISRSQIRASSHFYK